MRPSLGADFIPGSDFTAGLFLMGVLGSGFIPGSRFKGRALLMGALGLELIPGSRFIAGSRFMAASFLTEGCAATDRAVCFGAAVLVDFRAICFGLGAGLAGGSPNAGQADSASAPVDLRAVCLVFGAGLVGAASIFIFLVVFLAFLGGGSEKS